MMTDELKNGLTAFAERVEMFYGRRTTIFEFISINKTDFDRHFSTFGRYQIDLERVAWRTSGGRMIFSQAELYYEVSIDNLVAFQENEGDCFEFLEKYSDSVYRKTLLEFKRL
jgi:hypothetical protein